MPQLLADANVRGSMIYLDGPTVLGVLGGRTASVAKVRSRHATVPGQAIYLHSFGLFDPAQFIIPPLLVK
jgi:hypothetical protein